VCDHLLQQRQLRISDAYLWDELGRRVRHRQNPPETLQELHDALVHECNNIPQAFIQGLIGSMRRKCEAVNIVYIEKKNRQKSYNLNSYGHSK
jgi:hypothetical protein